MRTIASWVLGAALATSLAAGFVGCGKDDVEEARERMRKDGGGTPPAASPHGATGAPTAGAPMMGSDAPNDGNTVPLKQTGSGSVVELQRELGKLPDKTQAAQFENAFRLTFTSDATQRDYRKAQQLLGALLQVQPRFAPAYRTLAYAEFNLNPADPSVAMQHYEKAVELDPDYGEAHYAIAFMCAATGERDKGVSHYKKAMALGVADERKIGERFYADLLKPQ